MLKMLIIDDENVIQKFLNEISEENIITTDKVVKSQKSNILKYKDITLNKENYEILKNGEKIDLTVKEFDKLDNEGKIEWSSNGNPRIIKYADEHEGKKIQDIWRFKDPQKPSYPTEKNELLLEQIIKQSSTEDSIIMDCFAGSGTTLNAAYNLNRKWIGVDESNLAINTIKKKKIGDYLYIDIEKNDIENITYSKQLNLWDKLIKIPNVVNEY